MNVSPPTQAVPRPSWARVRLDALTARIGALRAYRREDLTMGYLFLLFPMAIFMVWFFLGMLFDLWISFQHWNVLSAPRPVGTRNYTYLFSDPIFRIAIVNTVEYAIVVVPVQTVIAFILALIVNQNIKGRNFFRTVFYFPSVTSSVAISLLFLYLFNNEGLINSMLSQIGIHGPNWLGDPHWALKSIMGLNIWTTTGTYMVIFLAALQDVPRDLLEAAAIDGATGIQAVLRITVPLIRPALFFIVATGLIGCLQLFDQAFVLSQGTGGPENSTMTAVLYIWVNAFQYSSYGIAAAASFVLFIIIFAATLTVNLIFRQEAM
jgi:multiple sugar transport system permease protein